MTDIAIWNWESGAPVPDARVVVCRPDFYGPLADELTWIRAADAIAASTTRRFIVSSTIGATEDGIGSFLRSIRDGAHVVPALYTERQADLAGIADLLRVRAEHRALVLCPRETIVMHELFCRYIHSEGRPPSGWGPHCRRIDPLAVDLVLIIPPPEAKTCSAQAKYANLAPKRRVG